MLEYRAKVLRDKQMALQKLGEAFHSNLDKQYCGKEQYIHLV